MLAVASEMLPFYPAQHTFVFHATNWSTA